MPHRNKTKTNGSHTTQIEAREQASMPPASRTESPRLMEHPMSWMRNEMESMFERFFGRPWMPMEESGRTDRFWNVDVEDNDKEILVRAEAPGFDAKDFNIHISGNLLTIEAEHRQETEEKKGDYRSWERRYGRFQRTIPLPAAVDTNKAEALIRNGVLELHLPRTEDAQRRRIEVKG